MGACYWCHWGWPKPIREIYEDCLAKLGGNRNPLHFGPAHLVWEDENWDLAQWCLDHFDEFKFDLTECELVIVRESLVRLIAVPVCRSDIARLVVPGTSSHYKLLISF